MSDTYDNEAAAAVTVALQELADQASNASPPKVSFIMADARLRRRRRRVLAGAVVGAALAGVAVAVPVVARTGSGDAVLAQVTTAPSCPDESRTTAGPQGASESGAQGQLVPGHPSVVTVCWYRHVSAARVLVLSRSSVVQGPALSALVARLDSTPTGLPSGAEVSCPVETLAGEPFVRAFFAYPGNRFVTMYAHLSGCRTASNGAFVTIPDADSFDGLPGD